MISLHDIPDPRYPMSQFNVKLLSVFLVTTIFTFSLFTQSTTADEKDRKQADLNNLQSKILKLKQIIDVKEDSKSRYTKQLKKIENDIAKVSRKARESKKEIADKRAELCRVAVIMNLNLYEII